MPVEHETEEMPNNPTMRGIAHRVIKLKVKGENRTKVTIVTSTTMGGNFPGFMARRLAPYVAMMGVTYPLKYFLNNRCMIDCDAEDGKNIGSLVCDVMLLQNKSPAAAVDSCMLLREFCTRWHFGKALILQLLRFKYLPSPDVNTELSKLSEAEAQYIGLG